MRIRCLFGRHRLKLYAHKTRGSTFVGQRCRDCSWKESPADYEWCWDLSPRVQRFWAYLSLRRMRTHREMYGEGFEKLRGEVFAHPFVPWKRDPAIMARYAR